VLPALERVFNEYKGKVRMTVRDFPLNFHDRAKPAGVAAHCAGDQGKFWSMYKVLFDNQQALTDADLEKHAQTAGLDVAKWKSCIANPAPKMALIEENMQSGIKYGVSGTPCYFINGRRLSGAMPFEEFKRVIDDELAKTKKG
jgi:protein-disulfide isomerase